MINLLPDNEKNALKMEEIRNRIFAILCFALIALVLFSSILCSLRFYLVHRENLAEKIFKTRQESLKSAEFDDFKKLVQETNVNLLKTEIFYGQQVFSATALEKLAKITPETVYFTNISSNKKVEKVKENGEEKEKIFVEFHVSGWAKTRQDLFLFKKEIESQKEFQDIYFNPSSWVLPSSAVFSFSFNYPLKPSN